MIDRSCTITLVYPSCWAIHEKVDRKLPYVQVPIPVQVDGPDVYSWLEAVSPIPYAISSDRYYDRETGKVKEGFEPMLPHEIPFVNQIGPNIGIQAVLLDDRELDDYGIPTMRRFYLRQTAGKWARVPIAGSLGVISPLLNSKAHPAIAETNLMYMKELEVQLSDPSFEDYGLVEEMYETLIHVNERLEEWTTENGALPRHVQSVFALGPMGKDAPQPAVP